MMTLGESKDGEIQRRELEILGRMTERWGDMEEDMGEGGIKMTYREVIYTEVDIEETRRGREKK